MKISLKVIFSVWIVIFGVLAIITYQAYSKLQPEAFISILREEVEKNYPGTKLQITKIDYRLSVDFNLRLKEIELVRQGKKLGSIGELEIKIPWWLFIANRGNAQINLSRLVIILDHDEKESKPAADIAQSSIKKAQKIKVELPEYLANAKFTLRAKDIVIKDSVDSRRYFNLSKLLVREFQYGKNSAFELNLPIEINHNGAAYKSDLWLFGDVTPTKNNWELNYRGEFKTVDVTEKFELEDLIIGGKALFNPSNFNLSSDMNLLIEKESIGSGKVIANKEELSINVTFEKFPLNYLSILKGELGNPYLPKFEGDAQGSLSFTKSNISETSTFQSKLSFDGLLILPSKTNFQGKWQLSLDDTKWETSFISPKGEVSYFRRSIIDYSVGTLVQFNEELGFSGLEMKEAMAPVIGLRQFDSMSSDLYFASVISFKDCLVGERIVSGGLNYGISPLQKFYQFELKDSVGNLRIDYVVKDESRLSISAKDFSWFPDLKLLEPYFSASAGIVNGEIESSFKENWKLGQWLVDANIKGLADGRGESLIMTQKIWSTFSLDSLLVPDQSWNLTLKNQLLNLNSLMLETVDPAKMTGTLSPEINKSFVTLTYPKNKKWKGVKKELPTFSL